MTTITVTGLGKVTIHLCNSEQNLAEKTTALKGVALFTPQAVILLRQQSDVMPSGVLYLPQGEEITLFAGGVLQTPSECIRTSFVLVDSEYAPNDFALA